MHKYTCLADALLLLYRVPQSAEDRRAVRAQRGKKKKRGAWCCEPAFLPSSSSSRARRITLGRRCFLSLAPAAIDSTEPHVSLARDINRYVIMYSWGRADETIKRSLSRLRRMCTANTRGIALFGLSRSASRRARACWGYDWWAFIDWRGKPCVADGSWKRGVFGLGKARRFTIVIRVKIGVSIIRLDCTLRDMCMCAVACVFLGDRLRIPIARVALTLVCSVTWLSKFEVWRIT